MGATRGKDFFLYRDTDDPYDNSPTWSHVANVRDLTRNGESDLADASIRGSTYHMQVPTLINAGIDFQMVYDGGDADQIAFQAAQISGDLIAVLDLDGDINTVGSKGLFMLAQVSKFVVNEALTDVGLVDISLVPGYAPDTLPRLVHVVTPGSVEDL